MTTRAKGGAIEKSGTSATATALLSGRQVENIARALSDRRRFQILRQIASNPCSACSDLRAAFPITAPTLSHHLKELEQAGLILTSKRGKFVDVHFRRDAGTPTSPSSAGSDPSRFVKVCVPFGTRSIN